MWNWAGMIFEMVAGFLLAPYLVRRLGVTTYGLWIVIGAFTGYFALLDLGLRGSVGRQLAYCRANNDLDGANSTLNSALAMFVSVAALILVATTVAVLMFDRILDIPADQLSNAQIALGIVGLNLALSFPLQIFDGYLWAAQRFDILNLVDIPAAALRVLMTFALVENILVTLLFSVSSLWSRRQGVDRQRRYQFPQRPIPSYSRQPREPRGCPRLVRLRLVELRSDDRQTYQNAAQSYPDRLRRWGCSGHTILNSAPASGLRT